MKKKTIATLICVALGGGISWAHAADVERGKKLFEDPKLGGGTTGRSCVTCHKGGARLGKDLFKKDHYTIMGQEKSSIEDVVNVCIENPLGGHSIDPEGKDMQDLIAYMKVLTGGE
jgi:cytochrome c